MELNEEISETDTWSDSEDDFRSQTSSDNIFSSPVPTNFVYHSIDSSSSLQNSPVNVVKTKKTQKKPNLLQKLFSRELHGKFSPHTRAPNLRLFDKVPKSCQLRLSDVLPVSALTNRHVFMGLSKCGRFLLTYTHCVEIDLSSFCNRHQYRLHWWLFTPRGRARKVDEVTLFGNVGVSCELYISICQWPTDATRILVHGTCLHSNRCQPTHAHVTLTAVPSLNRCVDCLRVAASYEEDDLAAAWDSCVRLSCSRHGLTMHTNYEVVCPYPKFRAEVSLKCDGALLINTGSFLHVLRAAMEERDDQAEEETCSGSPDDSTAEKLWRSLHAGVNTQMGLTCSPYSPPISPSSPPSDTSQITLVGSEDSDTCQLSPKMVEQEVETFNTSGEQVQKSGEQWRPKVESAQMDFDALKAKSYSVEHSPSKVEALKMKTESFVSNVENVKPNLENLKSKVENVKPSMENLKMKVENVKPSVENLKPNVENLKSKVESMKSKVENVKPSVDRVRSRADSGGVEAGPGETGMSDRDMIIRDFSDEVFLGIRRLHIKHPLSDRDAENARYTAKRRRMTSDDDGDAATLTPPSRLEVGAMAGKKEEPLDQDRMKACVKRCKSSQQEAAVYEFTDDVPPACEKLSSFRRRRLADKKYEFSEDTADAENIVPYRRRSPTSPPGTRRPEPPTDLGGDPDKAVLRPLNRNIGMMSPRPESKPPVKKACVASQPVPAPPASQPARLPGDRFTRTYTRRYLEMEDELVSVITDIEDDESGEAPSYILALPVEVHGAGYQQLQMVSNSKAVKMESRTVSVRQTSLDIEALCHDVAALMCQQAGVKYAFCQDYDVEILDVCPSSGDVISVAFMRILTSTETSGGSTLREQYQGECSFSWNMDTGCHRLLHTVPLKDSGPVNLGGPLWRQKTQPWGPARDRVMGLSKTRQPFPSPGPVRCISNETTFTGKPYTSLTDIDNLLEFQL